MSGIPPTGFYQSGWFHMMFGFGEVYLIDQYCLYGSGSQWIMRVIIMQEVMEI